MLPFCSRKRGRQSFTSSQFKEDGAFAPDADIYLFDISFDAGEDVAEQEYLMKIPTILCLTDEQINRPLRAVSRLFRDDPEFRRLMTELYGSL